MNNILTSKPFATPASNSRAPSFDIILTPDGTINATSPAWIVAFTRRIENLLKLQDGWDGVGSKRPQLNCVIEALEFLFGSLSHDTLPPQVVPTSEGGIQLEWHTKGIDLEITFSPGLRASFLFSSNSGPDFEGSVNDHTGFVSATLRVLRSTNARPAAR